MPPEPPSPEDEFIPGEFKYISDWSRPYIVDAYQVISRNEWWNSFKSALQSRGVNNRTGFIWSDDTLYNEIMDAIGNTSIGGGHSGASIAGVMRAMETIALHGEAEYRRQIIEYETSERRRESEAQAAAEALRRAREASARQRQVQEVATRLRRMEDDRRRNEINLLNQAEILSRIQASMLASDIARSVNSESNTTLEEDDNEQQSA